MYPAAKSSSVAYRSRTVDGARSASTCSFRPFASVAPRRISRWRFVTSWSKESGSSSCAATTVPGAANRA